MSNEEGKGLQLNNEKDLMAGGGGFSLAPSNLGEAMEFAKMMANTDMVPCDFQGKPANIMVAVQMGAEVGLKPLAALQNIAVINGRPSIWGDAAIALVKVHPDCESINEYFLNKKGEKTTGDDYDTAVCIVKRKGQDPETRTFSLAEAKKARLLGKSGPWSQYEKRMLQMRARGFALRDVFPDALKGLAIAEEAQDLPPRDITPPGSDTTIAPEFDVPSIDGERDVMVDNEDVIDVEPGQSEEDTSAPGKTEASTEESPFEEEKTDAPMTANEMVERIKTMGNSFEHKNWLKKHSKDINALSPADNKEVMKAYADQGEQINDTAPDNALSEDGYGALIDASESKEALERLWFDRIEVEVIDSKMKIRLRTSMNKKVADFGGN